MEIEESDSGELVESEEDEVDEWERFFPGQELTGSHPARELVRTFMQFLENHRHQLQRRERNLFVPFDLLEAQCPEGFVERLKHVPLEALPAMQLACYRYYKDYLRDRNMLLDFCDALVMPRIIEYPITALKSVKSHSINKLIGIRGTVIRASNIKPLIRRMSFRCARCASSVEKTFLDGKYSPPTRCSTPRCQSRKFTPELESAESADWQKIRIQENIDGMRETGRMPRTIEVELQEELVDMCVPGDVVTVVGVVNREAIDKAQMRSKTKKAAYYIYLRANSIVNNKQNAASRVIVEDYSKRELRMLEKILESENPFRDIVNSLCPSIYGHELVKAGLCLALFGGCQRYTGNGGGKGGAETGESLTDVVRIRGDPHVLIVGDPGLGKSQMLRAITALAPRGVYVCGSYSSTSGLTVTLLRDPSTGDYMLEAGALVLADQGICAIDEFDKMSHEHQALLEAMEQQTISIAKAGIVCSLMARTSVIAAANPSGGHYDRSKTVPENLKMSPALLSRFDLVFILLDRPDEAMDQKLSEHVMSLHSGRSNSAASSMEPSSAQEGLRGATQQTSSQVGRRLVEYLKNAPPDFSPIPAEALRKYIAYARKYVHPRLSGEAATIIQQFYLKLRKNYMSRDATPITNRQLESLIRLAEARARAELREEVTACDAEEVVQIMEESLMENWEDQFGNIDVRRSTGMSKGKLKQAFVAALNAEADRSGNQFFTMYQLRDIAETLGFTQQVPDFYGFVEQLNQAGFLLKTGPRTYVLPG